jgi:lipopolysaccharide export system ATP-binding protein
MDEPFSGVDPVAVSGLAQTIRGLVADGLGVLLTDHAVRAALGVCDRVVLLDQGRVMASGTPAEVAADERVRDRYLGPDFDVA